MASSQRKPVCLICPFSWDINPRFMGIYVVKKRCRKRLTPIKGKIFLFCPDKVSRLYLGTSPLHQFWSYSFLPFCPGTLGTQHSPAGDGCWLECRWVADRADSGELRSRRAYLHEFPTFWLSLWLGLCLGLVPSDTGDVEGWLNWLPGPRASLYGLFGFAPLS